MAKGKTKDAPETFATDAQGRTIFPLKHSVDFEGGTVSELKFRRPKGKDIKKLTKASDEMDGVFVLFGDLSERGPQLIEELDAEDIVRLTDLLDGWGLDLGK